MRAFLVIVAFLVGLVKGQVLDGDKEAYPYKEKDEILSYKALDRPFRMNKVCYTSFDQ